MKPHTPLLKHFFATLLFSTLVLVSPNSPAADSFEDGEQAYEAGDYKKASEIFKPLAEQGYGLSQYNLGLMFVNGQGVPQDYVQAHKWFNLFASRSQGKIHEQSVHNRDVIEKRMTPAQVAEAQKLAREWKPKPNKSP